MWNCKSYTCSNCGSVLNVESDRADLTCPFCGTSFNAASFHRNELLQQAFANLRRKEFSAARDKFRTVNEGDPHNFDALLGRVCCAAEVRSTKEFSDILTTSRCNLKNAKAAIHTLEGCHIPEFEPFFSSLDTLLSKAYRYTVMEKELSRIRKESNFVIDDLDGTKAKEETMSTIFVDILCLIGSLAGFFLSSSLDDHDTNMIIGLIAIAIFLMITLIIGLGAVKGLIYWGIIMGIIIAIVIANSLIISKIYGKKKGKLLEATANKHNEYDKKKEEMENLSREFHEQYLKLAELRPDTTSGIIRPKDTRLQDAEDFFSGEEKEIHCSKCSATLTLDRERHLYTCKYCGVAYGTSFFIGDVLKRGQNALANKEFEEAEIRFSHYLMMHPGNYDALLGKILATGLWTSVEAMDFPVRMPPFRVKDLDKCIKEAEASASESDKPIFESFDAIPELLKRGGEHGPKKDDSTYHEDIWKVSREDFMRLRAKIKYLDESRTTTA